MSTMRTVEIHRFAAPTYVTVSRVQDNPFHNTTSGYFHPTQSSLDRLNHLLDIEYKGKAYSRLSKYGIRISYKSLKG